MQKYMIVQAQCLHTCLAKQRTCLSFYNKILLPKANNYYHPHDNSHENPCKIKLANLPKKKILHYTILWLQTTAVFFKKALMTQYNYWAWGICYGKFSAESFLPCEPPQFGTAGASLWHQWNDPHPRSSLWHPRLPAPARPLHLLDAEGTE